jgi:hypothetical protein
LSYLRREEAALSINNLPQPFWAILLALMGLVLAVAVLFNGSNDNIKLAVLAVSSSLVSGALGAFAGHANAVSNTTATGPNTTINPIQPGQPGQQQPSTMK